MTKLLILNCTLAKSGIDRLNNLFNEIFSKLDIDFKIYHLSETINHTETFSHLIISGSALLVSEENKNDYKIYELIQQFSDKNILGICYGHQILAKALMNENVCIKSKTPELGWRKVELIDNPLFTGISDPIFYESHLEEVYGLNEKFNIIASNNNCDIQAYQYDKLNIWGVQFHPEVTLEHGEQSIRNKLSNNPALRKTFYNEKNYQNKIEQNLKIFENFINI